VSPASGERAGLPGHLIALLVLVLVPLGLRLWPIDHGMPESYVPDTHVVKNALGMARDKHPVPPSGRYSTYPYLLSYVLLPVYAGEYALGRATGAWAGAGEFGNALLEDPSLAHLPARIVLALLCALTPWVVFRATRAAGLGKGAWVAAWLVATGLLHVHFSVQERPWGVLSLLFALTAWPAARYVAEPRKRTLLLAGLAAGLAFATHQAGILALGLAGLAWALGRPWRGGDLRARAVDGVACVALFAVVALVLGHPYWLVHGAPEAASFDDAPEVDVAIGGQALILDVRWASFVRLSKALVGYDGAIVVLAALGLWGALAQRGTRPVTLFALAWLAFFLTNQNDHVRYLLPAAVLLVWPAGVAAELLLARRWGVLVLAPLLVFPLVQALRLAWVLDRPDTREQAAALLSGDLPESARVAIDRYGPNLPLDRASLERLAGWRELGSRERHRLAYLEAGLEPPGPGSMAGRGVDAIPIGDLFRFWDRRRTYALAPTPAESPELAGTADDAGAVLRALGVTHVLLVDRRPGDGVPPALVDAAPALDGFEKPRPLSVGDPILVVDPAGGGATPREALLPTDMDFPLTGLWQVERPGPRLVLAPLAR
jgi:hypothetical protein